MVLQKNLTYDNNDSVTYIKPCLLFQKGLLLVSALGVLKRLWKYYFKIHVNFFVAIFLPDPRFS